MIFCNNNSSLLILELVSGYVNYETLSLKPRMGTTFTFSKYVVKIAVFLLLRYLASRRAASPQAPQGKS